MRSRYRSAGGVSSDIYRVDAGGQTLCVKRALPKLKVAADWRAPVERNAYEAAWLRLAAARSFRRRCPRVLAEDRGERRVRDGVAAAGALPGLEGAAARRRDRRGDRGPRR